MNSFPNVSQRMEASRANAEMQTSLEILSDTHNKALQDVNTEIAQLSESEKLFQAEALELQEQINVSLDIMHTW